MDVNVSIQRVALRDLEPNPYRHIKRQLYDQEKLHRLQASYTESGFWDGSIHARPHPTKPRKYQLAFGHHRIKAAELLRDPDAPEAVTNRAVESILIAASSAKDQATHAKAPPEMIKRATRAAAKAAMNAIVDKGSGFGTTKRATYVGKETANRMLRLCGLRTDAKVQNITDLIVKTVDRVIDRSLLFLADIQERLMDALPYRDQTPDEVITNLVRVLRKQAKAVHDTLMRLADEWEHQETKNVTPTIKKLAPGEGHSTSERRT